MATVAQHLRVGKRVGTALADRDAVVHDSGGRAVAFASAVGAVDDDGTQLGREAP
jgi:hypothetical protein